MYKPVVIPQRAISTCFSVKTGRVLGLVSSRRETSLEMGVCTAGGSLWGSLEGRYSSSHMLEKNRVREGWPVGRLKRQYQLRLRCLQNKSHFFSWIRGRGGSSHYSESLHLIHSYTPAAYTSGKPPICHAMCWVLKISMRS